MKGLVTKVFEDRGYFLIDNDYRCYFDRVNFKPKVFDQVEYEQSKDKNGKPRAERVKLLSISDSSINKTTQDFFSQYLDELTNGYFIKDDFIKKEYVLEYAKDLANEFTKNENVNKPTQIRKYFDYCDKINGIYKVKRNFLYVQAELPKVIAHLNNALKKGLISNDFVTFLEKNIELAIIEEKNFVKGFIPHFEAVIGFSQKIN